MGCCVGSEASAGVRKGTANTKNIDDNSNENNKKDLVAKPKRKKQRPQDAEEDALNRQLLNRMLENFGATYIAPHDSAQQRAVKCHSSGSSDDEFAFDLARTPYRLFPATKAQAFLGKGGFSEVYRVRTVQPENNNNSGNGSNNNSNSDPTAADSHPTDLSCVKVLKKSKLIASRCVRHLAAELAVAMWVFSPRLNHCQRVYHSDTHVYMILDLIHSPTPNSFSRIAHIMALYAPSKICDIQQVHGTLLQEAGRENVNIFDEHEVSEYGERSGFYQRLVVNCGASPAKVAKMKMRGEVPFSGDMFHYVSCQPRKFIPDPIIKIVLKQILQGLRDLHQHNFVSRDIKPENIVIAVARDCEVVDDDDDNDGAEGGNKQQQQQQRVILRETFDVKIVDYGLAKFLKKPARHLQAAAATSGEGVAAATAAAPSGSLQNEGMVHSMSDFLVPTASSLKQQFDQTKQHPQQEQKENNNNSSGEKQPDNQRPLLVMDDVPMFESINPGSSRSATSPNAVETTKTAGATAAMNRSTTSDSAANHEPFFAEDSPLRVTTACGTIIYAPMETLMHAINQSDDREFCSSSRLLKKVDIFGAGVCCYVMSQGRAPFRSGQQQQQGANVSRDEKIKSIIAEMRSGLDFRDDAPATEELKDFIRLLMSTDAAQRPDAVEALASPFFDGVGDTAVSEYLPDGTVRVTLVAAPIADDAVVVDGGADLAASISSRRGSVLLSAHRSPSMVLSSAYNSPSRIQRDADHRASSASPDAAAPDSTQQEQHGVDDGDHGRQSETTTTTMTMAGGELCSAQDDQNAILEALRQEEDEEGGAEGNEIVIMISDGDLDEDLDEEEEEEEEQIQHADCKSQNNTQ